MDIFNTYSRNQCLSDEKELGSFLTGNQIIFKSIKCVASPSVLSYEIEPLKETRIGNIMKLKNDIALLLKTDYINIIPSYRDQGKIVIEVKNNHPYLLGIKELINDLPEPAGNLPILLGTDMQNRTVYKDLCEMPHLLIAGATGQGKSVCLHSMISSLVYHKEFTEVKFVFIDPKLVELSIYKDLLNFHFFNSPGKILTEPNEVVTAIHDLIDEMNKRYKILEHKGKRNIKELDIEMPYIVVVIDEFADILQEVGLEFQKLIIKLAQKSRAVGIHLILATQRPSVKIVSGEIKTNFPARIAFKCVSRGDSQTVLGYAGAEKLFGNGDALLLNNASLIRFQGALVTQEETTRLIEYVNGKYSSLVEVDPGAISEPEKIVESQANVQIDENAILKQINKSPVFYKHVIDEMQLLKIISAKDHFASLRNVQFKYLPLWKVVFVCQKQNFEKTIYFYDTPISVVMLKDEEITSQPFSSSNLDIKEIESFNPKEIPLSDNQNVAFYHQYDHFSDNFYWELKSETNKNNEWRIMSLEKILYPYWQYGVGMGIAANSGVLIDAVFGYKLGAMP